MSTTRSATTRRFRVERRDEAGGDTRIMGTVAISPDGRIDILAEADDPGRSLALIVAEQNQRPNLNVPVAPPADAPPFARMSRVVGRGEPEFVEALADYLRRYHAIELVEM